MKFIITDPIPVAEPPKDSYVVEVQSMQGDADGYHDFTVGPFKKGQDEAPLQSLLETLERMDAAFSPGGRRPDTYNDVLGHLQWFGTEIVTIDSLRQHYPNLLNKHGEEVHQELIDLTQNENHYAEWRGDAMTDYTRDERLTKYGVVYYNEAGVKFKVEVQH